MYTPKLAFILLIVTYSREFYQWQSLCKNKDAILVMIAFISRTFAFVEEYRFLESLLANRYW